MLFTKFLHPIRTLIPVLRLTQVTREYKQEENNESCSTDSSTRSFRKEDRTKKRADLPEIHSFTGFAHRCQKEKGGLESFAGYS